MNKITKTILLITTISLFLLGCDKEPIDDTVLSVSSDLPVYEYTILISFVDGSGKDLVSSLGEERWQPDGDNTIWGGQINPEKYSLNFIYSNPPSYFTEEQLSLDSCVAPFFALKFDNYQIPYQTYEQYIEGEGRWYLYNRLRHFIRAWGKDALRQDNIIYRFSCPTVFGDNSTHELIAYWGDDPAPSSNPDAGLHPECIRALFDGQEIPVKKVTVVTRYEVQSGTIDVERLQYFIDIVLDK